MAKETNAEKLNEDLLVDKAHTAELFEQLMLQIGTQIKQFVGPDAVLIGNCPVNTNKKDLDSFFHGFATIVKLHRIDCAALKTTLFVAKFDSVESASRSKVLNTLSLNGKKILLVKADGKQLFDKSTVVELNGLQEHAEELIYDHMITFGNINFILKTSTVTYIVFEEVTAVKISCQCDYLDKYPVTIRPVRNCAVGGSTGTSIETCILEQIVQNDNPVEEEVQINSFMQLLDMENLDDYVEVDDKVKNTDLSAKPLLEIGNEEIIATEDDLLDSSEEGADVNEIEKQALYKKSNEKAATLGFVVVDVQTARQLKLKDSILRLSKLPKLQVVVQDCGIEKFRSVCNKMKAKNKMSSKILFQPQFERCGKPIGAKNRVNSLVHKEKDRTAPININTEDVPINTCPENLSKHIELSQISLLHTTPYHDKAKVPVKSISLSYVDENKQLSMIKHVCNKHSEIMIKSKHIATEGHSQIIKSASKNINDKQFALSQQANMKTLHDESIYYSGAASIKYSKRVAYVGVVKLSQMDIEQLSVCRVVNSVKNTDMKINHTIKESERIVIVEENESMRVDTEQPHPEAKHTKQSEHDQDTLIEKVLSPIHNCFAEEPKQVKFDCVNEHTNERFHLDASDARGTISSENLGIVVTKSVSDNINMIEMEPNVFADSVVSDEEEPLIIDLPTEQIISHSPLLEQDETRESFVLVDRKSAVLLGKFIRHDHRLNLAELPCLKIKVKRLSESEYKRYKSKETIKKSKISSNKVAISTSIKNRVAIIQERPRKTDLEKIDNKFLPAGSKLKSQAKAKYRQDNSNRNKHVPVPELPIELKAHLNTSFKIPKKNIAVKPLSIERNPSELNCLHKDQTGQGYRRRFQKERRQWEDRIMQPGPREKKLKYIKQDLVSTASDYFDTFNENCDSLPTEKCQNKTSFSHMKSATLCDQRGIRAPTFEDIWNIPIVRPKVWNNDSVDLVSTCKATSAPSQLDSNEPDKSVMNWDDDSQKQNSNFSKSSLPTPTVQQHYESNINKTIDDGESWSPEASQTSEKISEKRSPLKFNLKPELQFVRAASQEHKDNRNTMMEIAVKRDSATKINRQQVSPNRVFSNVSFLSGETWDDEIERENNLKNNDRQMQPRPVGFMRQNLESSNPVPWNEEDVHSIRNNQILGGNSPVDRCRSRYPHSGKKQVESLERSSLRRQSRGVSRDKSDTRKRSRSRSPQRMIRSDNRSPISRGWTSNDHASKNSKKLHHRASNSWGRSNYNSPVRRSRSPVIQRHSRDRSPVNSRHNMVRTFLNRQCDDRSKLADRYDNRSPVIEHPSSLLDEYNRNLERIIHSQNRQTSPDNYWEQTSVPYRQPWSYGSPKSTHSPSSDSQNWNRTPELQYRWPKMSSSSGGKMNTLNTHSFEENKKRAKTHIDKNQDQENCIAYSPSNAWDALSSEDDGDFTSYESRNAQSEIIEKIPLLWPRSTKSAQIQLKNLTLKPTVSQHFENAQESSETLSGNFDTKDVNSTAPVDRLEKIPEFTDIGVIPEKLPLINLQAVTQQKEETTEKRNVLEHLKQRAERLKQLEEMKLARQKLLAQIKLKSDKVLNVELDDELDNDSDPKAIEEIELASSPIAPSSLFETADTLLSHLDSMLSRPAPVITSTLRTQSITPIPSDKVLSIPPLPEEAKPPLPPDDPPLITDNSLNRSNCMLPTNQWQTSIPHIDLSQPPPHMNLLHGLQQPHNQQTQFSSANNFWQVQSQPCDVPIHFGRREQGQLNLLSISSKSNYDNTPQKETFQLRPPEEVRQNKFKPRQQRHTLHQGMIRDPRQSSGDNGFGVYSHNNNDNNRSTQFRQFGANQRYQQHRFKRNQQQFFAHNFQRKNYDEGCFDMNLHGCTDWFD